MTPEPTHRLPPTLGVIGYQNRIICYELADEYGDAGRTGRQLIEARILGSTTLMELTADLQAAIQADLRKRNPA